MNRNKLRGFYITDEEIYSVIYTEYGVLLSDSNGSIMQFETEKAADDWLKEKHLISLVNTI